MSKSVFLLHAGDGGTKAGWALPCARLFEFRGIQAFVDEVDLTSGNNSPRMMKDSAIAAEVLIVFLDNHYFINSVYCMEELRDAVERETQLVFPVFLNRLDPKDYPRAPSNLRDNKGFEMAWGNDWKEQVIKVLDTVLSLNGFRAKEDKVGIERIVTIFQPQKQERRH